MANVSKGIDAKAFVSFVNDPTHHVNHLEREGLVENANNLGGFLKQGLQNIKDNSPIVGNVMSQGLIASIELVQDKDTKESFDASKMIAARVFEAALERGLITRAIAIDNTDIIAICPPLTITKEELSILLEILDEYIATVNKQILK